MKSDIVTAQGARMRGIAQVAHVTGSPEPAKHARGAAATLPRDAFDITPAGLIEGLF